VVDDRRKPARAPTFGDRNESRRRTPAHGYPVHVDPEETPPPQMPPELEDGGIADRVDRLETGVTQMIEAFGKVWDARKDGNRLETMSKDMSAIATMATRHQTLLDELLVPQLDHWRATTDKLSAEIPRLAAAAEGLRLMVSSIDQKQISLEVKHGTSEARTAGEIKDLGARVAAVDNALGEHRKRIDQLELANRDESVAIEAVATSDRKRLNIIRAAVVVGSTVFGFVVAKGAAILSWLSGH
jgi:hypothetical protein